ncbi:helix-turn-helix transcriptional regulator [bacterium]|nr:helix-turn-helix transcriptional regulator [bacterium]
MEQNLRKKLAHNIKVERAKADLTQEKLAELSAISAKHITKIENMKVTPSIYIVYKIAKVFKVSIDELLK